MLTFFWSLAFFGSLIAYSQLVANSRFLQNTDKALQSIGTSLPSAEETTAPALIAEAKRRALLYDDQIQANHLVDGMVVNRTSAGDMQDQCDSLLFSSLRYVSLIKLGWRDRAEQAWEAIEKSQDNGSWLRHPRCLKSTSRDMLLGLLIAMSQEPKGFGEHLQSLIELVDKQDGYFSTGPIYVSYLSPGLARFIGLLAPQGLVDKKSMPDIIRSGYSTAELEVMVTDQGYESHLGALTAWLELELNSRGNLSTETAGIFAKALDALVSPFGSFSLYHQRLDWITDQLVNNDPDNLFYRYLRLRAAGALTKTFRLRMLAELLTMPHFPKDRLPMNCDRFADYLWQRANRAPTRDPIACTLQFSGTDFLWMASLLLEEQPEQTARAH